MVEASDRSARPGRPPGVSRYEVKVGIVAQRDDDPGEALAAAMARLRDVIAARRDARPATRVYDELLEEEQRLTDRVSELSRLIRRQNEDPASLRPNGRDDDAR